MTLVAPGERFNALAILVTPFLSRAIDFNNRRSSLVHARRATFFFLAIIAPDVGAAFYHIETVLQRTALFVRVCSLPEDPFRLIYPTIILANLFLPKPRRH
jgi:hypothetical protein